MGFGEIVHVTFAGGAQVRDILLPVKPLGIVTLILNVAGVPLVTLTALVGPVKHISVAEQPVPVGVADDVPLPMPVSVTGGRLSPLPVLTIRVPDRVPGALGVKVTPIVHDCPGNRLLTQVFKFAGTAKSVLAGCTRLAGIRVKFASVFVRVTVCAVALVVFTGVLANERVAGETESLTNTPLPVSGTSCGLFVASSGICNVPVRVPACDGVKVTVTAQELPALSCVPQVLADNEKSLGAVMPMPGPSGGLRKWSVAVPELVSVTVCICATVDPVSTA